MSEPKIATADLDRLKAAKIRLAQLKKQRDQYINDNRIEFFGIVDEAAGLKGPNPAQKQLLEAWEDPNYKVFTFTGANRIGKTTIGVIIALSTLFGKWPWNGKQLTFSHNQPRRVRYVGQDWAKHIKAVVEPEINKWWPKRRPCKKKKNNEGIEFFWIDEETGSTLEIMSNKQESDLHEGWSGDLVVYDEPPKRDIRVANARGLIDRQGRELFCMTLLKEAWVDREVIKAVTPEGNPDTSVFNINADISVNIGYGLTQEGVDQFAKALTDEEKDARLRGIPSYLSGLVYPQFSRRLHLKKRFPIPLDWPVDISIDIHPREKQAVLFVATDQRGYRYACFEIWEHGDGTYIGEQIVRIVTSNALRVNRILIDPLSKADSNVDKDEAYIVENSTFNKVERVLASHGLPLECAVKAKTSGILEVRKHLIGPNNEPSIFFFDDLKRTIFEIEGYMYDDNGNPADVDDHMMENLYRILLLDTKWTDPRVKRAKKKPINWKVL